ncbi:MAG: hypothetical protein R2795_06750 [Saprospiraceae bacterium]
MGCLHMTIQTAVLIRSHLWNLVLM